MPRLPCHDGIHQPLTLDLNGKVLVRCRETETSRPTELRLSATKLVGEPIVLNTNRRYVERPLRLGFRSVGLFGPESPALGLCRRRGDARNAGCRLLGADDGRYRGALDDTLARTTISQVSNVAG